LLRGLAFAEDDLRYCGALPAFQIQVGDGVHVVAAVCADWAVPWMGI
jgi:hypothetical protein